MNIKEELLALQDISYADFQAKLTPNIPRDLFIGVRVPELRKLAKKVAEDPETSKFLKDLPHKYYDENMLHGLLISEIKDYDACIVAVEKTEAAKEDIREHFKDLMEENAKDVEAALEEIEVTEVRRGILEDERRKSQRSRKSKRSCR